MGQINFGGHKRVIEDVKTVVLSRSCTIVDSPVRRALQIESL